MVEIRNSTTLATMQRILFTLTLATMILVQRQRIAGYQSLRTFERTDKEISQLVDQHLKHVEQDPERHSIAYFTMSWISAKDIKALVRKPPRCLAYSSGHNVPCNYALLVEKTLV